MVGGYNREVSKRKALRKQRMAHDWYNNLHQYSKNKIHCSCSMCSAKSKNKGKRRMKRGNYASSQNWKHSDLIKIAAMDEQTAELE
jgi:hypothetical protein